MKHIKNILVVISITMLSISAFGQTKIKLEKDGGIYKIQCKVNGAPMKMYFDTGATVVSISLSTAMYLLENDLVEREDFVGLTKTMTADGSVIDNMKLIIKDVEIAGLHLKNVEAVVSSSSTAPLLLGQSAIGKLGKITLDGDFLIIHSISNQELTLDQRRNWDMQLRLLRKEKKDTEILDLISKIEKTDRLNEYELYLKIVSKFNLDENREIINLAEEWINSFSHTCDSIEWKMFVYFAAATANVYGDGDMEKGISYLERCKSYWEKQHEALFYWGELPFIYGSYCEKTGKPLLFAIVACKRSIKFFLNKDNISVEMINQNQVKNWNHANFLHLLSVDYSKEIEKQCFEEQREINQTEIDRLNYTCILAAKAGSPFSIDYCRSNNINYSKKLSKKELNLIGLDYNY